MAMEFGLVGRKLGHSFSKAYFTEKFRALGLEARYENFELATLDGFGTLPGLHPNLRGLNVTLPFKEAIIPNLHGLSETAAAIGAVNTIQFREGQLIGHNTDAIGFRDSLAQVYAGAPGGKALILGKGGSAKAVRYALEHYGGFEEVWNASRTPEGDFDLGYDLLKAQGLQAYRLIVNCTPVGMAPHEEERPDLPYDTLAGGSLVYDLIYNPSETPLLKTAKAHGCTTTNGMDMLIRQAEASWEIWMQTAGQPGISRKFSSHSAQPPRSSP